MQPTLNDQLLKILTIINYLDNKDKFIKEFDKLNRVETMMNLLEKLPKAIQDQITSGRDQYEQAEAIKKHISQAEYLPEFIKVSNHALRGFLQDIEHTLSVDQKQKITQLIGHH